jgi:hypothetical protein
MFYTLFYILIIILVIFVYLHIYIHFSVNPSNKMTELEDLTKQTITDTIYMKLPFLFNGTTIMNNLDQSLNNKIDSSSNKYYKTYSIIYKSIPLLEPSVKFFPSSLVYSISKKNKFIPFERNLECRNFYIIHSGKANITCIHPKYKDHFVSGNIKDDMIKTNDNFIHLELYPNSVLFVPNYWYVHIESLEKDTMIEKIQYSTILNQSCFHYENVMNH